QSPITGLQVLGGANGPACGPAHPMSSSSGGPGLLRARVYARVLIQFMAKLVRALCRPITWATLARVSHAAPVGFRTRVAVAEPAGFPGRTRSTRPVRVGP